MEITTAMTRRIEREQINIDKRTNTDSNYNTEIITNGKHIKPRIEKNTQERKTLSRPIHGKENTQNKKS